MKLFYKLEENRRLYSENIDKIRGEQVFSNYKSLCDYLGQPILSGNSKKAQIKEWKRHFDFSRKGQKIIIEKKYGVLKDRIDNRRFNGKSKYSQLIENIFIYYCSDICKTNFRCIHLTLNQIVIICGMANANYGYRNIYQILKSQNFNYFNILDFIFRTKNKFNAIVNSAFNSMKKRGIIDVDKSLMISVGGVHRLADVSEINYIKLMEEAVLNSMDENSMSDIVLAGKYNGYCKRVKKKVLSEINADYFYRGYSIKIKELGDAKNRSQTDYLNMKSHLNKEVINYFNNQAKNKELAYCNNLSSNIKLPNNYLLEQEKLADLLLKD